MKPWDIYTWDFPEAGEHPAIILGVEDRLKNKAKVNVLLCSSHRSTRSPEPHEVILDTADGLDWPTLCKCDFVFSVPLVHLKQKRGSVTLMRRRQIAAAVVRALGFSGL